VDPAMICPTSKAERNMNFIISWEAGIASREKKKKKKKKMCNLTITAEQKDSM
jgi:hypothetical protein